MVIYHRRVQGVTTQLYNRATWRALTGRRCMTTKLEGYAVCHIQASKISSVKSRLCLSVCFSLSKSVKYHKAAAVWGDSLFSVGGGGRKTHIWTYLWLVRFLFSTANWARGICKNINQSHRTCAACVSLIELSHQWGKFNVKPCVCCCYSLWLSINPNPCIS